MANITASAVKSLRDRVGLPMMDCKKALQECDGDEESAVQWLRERGAKTLEKRADRETSFGRLGIYVAMDPGSGAMVELKCESAPVTKSEEFIQLADDLAQVFALTPSITTAEQLLAAPSPSQSGKTLGDVKDEMFNRIREVFNVGRMTRIDGPCGGYSHNLGTVSGVLVEVTGGSAEAAKDVAMHVAAMRPQALQTSELDQEIVSREREILSEQARQEGKPDNIVEKMVEGRMRSFYAENVLLEQAFVKEPKLTVEKFAAQHGMQVKQFVHWELGTEG